MEPMNSSLKLDNRLLFAIPSKGSLHQAALGLLDNADIYRSPGRSIGIALVKNLPVTLIFLPASEIPAFVSDGHADLGIARSDQVWNHDAKVRTKHAGEKSGCAIITQLGFGISKLQLQVPRWSRFAHPRDLLGSTIATRLPDLTNAYFSKLGTCKSESESESEKTASHTRTPNGNTTCPLNNTKVIKLRGSVEVACAIGFADAVVDRVDPGDVAKAIDFEVLDTICESEAVLLTSQTLPRNPDLVDLIAARICGVVASRESVLCKYTIERHHLCDAMRLVSPRKRVSPATTTPTLNVESLRGGSGWMAVRSIVEKSAIAKTMDDLSGAGARDITILEVSNAR